MDIAALGGDRVVRGDDVDVEASREARRRRRLWRVVAVLAAIATYAWWRLLTGDPIEPGWPRVPDGLLPFLPALFLTVMLTAVILLPMLGSGRSPHVLYRASELEVGLDDVVGADQQKEEAVRTLNLFLGHKRFAEEMGGTPRRGVLFEGPPGTGKTHLAKAMAKEAGVPFLFVSATSFQSHFYGMTGRKIRQLFKVLRKVAAEEGGAIAFIEEFDAIGAARSGMGDGNPGSMREGLAGVVNELLVQMQSFSSRTTGQRFAGWWRDRINAYLPAHRHLPRPKVSEPNILVIAATNRAADLDPALLRPGRFDRSIHFGLPGREERKALLGYYLAKKAHDPELDLDAERDALAAVTIGYTPVRIERLLDEALAYALRRGATALGWADIREAQLSVDLGLRAPATYTPAERARIATHEAGHATVAHLVGEGQTITLVSIVKRAEALGLCAYRDDDERFLQTRSELFARMQVAFGGLLAEELSFGEGSTGPSADLAAATNVAAAMVGALGMSGSRISLDAAVMGGAGNLVAKVLSDEPSRAKVEQLLAEVEEQTRELLARHWGLLAAMRDALLEREEVAGDDVAAVFASARPDLIDLTDAGALSGPGSPR